MICRPVSLVLLFLLLPTMSVSASEAVKASCTEGLSEYVAGNYTQAFTLLKKQADSGLDCAQHWVARMYQMGHGTPMNRNKSMVYYQLAAGQGFPQAILQLKILK